MCRNFNLTVYGTIFTHCFLHFSKYVNGNLQVSVFGTDPKTKLRGHFLDISLEQSTVKLEEDQIVVNTQYKPELVDQLETLGILKERIGMCAINFTLYPIYTVDIPMLSEYAYAESLLCA